MELAEQSPTSSAADVNKLSCAIHSIPKSPQEQLPCSPHDAFVDWARSAGFVVAAAGKGTSERHGGTTCHFLG
jgi:hypothetical protein